MPERCPKRSAIDFAVKTFDCLCEQPYWVISRWLAGAPTCIQIWTLMHEELVVKVVSASKSLINCMEFEFFLGPLKVPKLRQALPSIELFPTLIHQTGSEWQSWLNCNYLSQNSWSIEKRRHIFLTILYPSVVPWKWLCKIWNCVCKMNSISACTRWIQKISLKGPCRKVADVLIESTCQTGPVSGLTGITHLK